MFTEPHGMSNNLEARFAESLATILPLPFLKGEGRGEGFIRRPRFPRRSTPDTHKHRMQSKTIGANPLSALLSNNSAQSCGCRPPRRLPSVTHDTCGASRKHADQSSHCG